MLIRMTERFDQIVDGELLRRFPSGLTFRVDEAIGEAVIAAGAGHEIDAVAVPVVNRQAFKSSRRSRRS